MVVTMNIVNCLSTSNKETFSQNVLALPSEFLKMNICFLGMLMVFKYVYRDDMYVIYVTTHDNICHYTWSYMSLHMVIYVLHMVIYVTTHGDICHYTW